MLRYELFCACLRPGTDHSARGWYLVQGIALVGGCEAAMACNARLVVPGKGGIVIDPRGERFTPDNIEERLALRSFMEEMRSSGVQTGGPAPFSTRDQKAFADQLDRLMHQLMRDA